jgi:hypothetical protein
MDKKKKTIQKHFLKYLLKKVRKILAKIFQKISIWLFLDYSLSYKKIWWYHWIELVELYLEHHWNTWNMFSGESVVELLH